jgi:hypothetical protein
VTFDATGVQAGKYLADIQVTSNDPLAPLVHVPITMRAGIEEVYLPRIWRQSR